MFKKQRLVLLILIACCYQISFSQVEKKRKDSSAMYKQIQTYSKKNKFTKLFHKLVFRPVNLKTKDLAIAPKVFKTFEGKIIRNINIVTLDPFGYSELDTTKKPRNWAERSGNRIHIKTSRSAIRNVLLIKKNKPFDSLLVKESERLIRTQRYISRVDIAPQIILNNSDSIDINIRVLDSWSIIPKGSVSSSGSRFEIIDRNIIGSGHELNTKFRNRFSDGKNAYGVGYTIPNFKNTFIKTTVNYQIDLDDYYSKSINIERLFYSALTKWAGGIYLDTQFRKDTLPDNNRVFSYQNFKYNSHDLWLGYAFKILNRNTESDRTTNLILAGRFLNVKYLESPALVYDPEKFYTNEQFSFLGIGLASRKFVQDNYIFRNGIIEDVPIGKIFGITSGYQFKNNLGRYYIGARAAFGNYYKWGFLSANFELGTFLNKSITEQSAFSFQANYFTKLMSFGKWKLRQFVKPQLIIGSKRLNSIGDQLSINDNNGIQGFNSPEYGTQKAIMTLQTQAYAPWNLWGFRLNPYFNYSIALLGTTSSGLLVSKAYSKVGIGMIINNDFLIFSAFQISLSYYPSIPGTGENVFKTNSFETTDFGFQDFDLGKPRAIIFK